MQKKIKIVNVQFGTDRSALCVSETESLHQNEFPPSKIKQYLMRVLQALNQTAQQRVETVKNLINEESLPILNLFLEHYLFTHYTKLVQSSPPQFNLENSRKERPQSENQVAKWYKQLSLKNYEILEKQKKQKQEIEKMQRKLAESMNYIQYMKDKTQRNEKQLKSKSEQLMKLKRENSSIMQKINKNKILKQMCAHSNALLANFHLNTLVYRNPKEIMFDLDYNSKITDDQSENNAQNLFYRTCYQAYGTDGNKIKNFNDKIMDKNQNLGKGKINYPKTSQKNDRKRQLRKSYDKWTINKISSTLNASEKQKQNIRQKCVENGHGMTEMSHPNQHKKGKVLKNIINM